MSEADILCDIEGACGVFTLNRPNALNALTLGMVREMMRALDRWESDAAIKTIVVKAAGEKAFCAGGDVKRLYELGKAGAYAEQLAFWREEYILNRRIKLYPKPYVALIDGIIMGGGAGIALHGSHRIAGDRFSFAMPEVGIGLFPDVGGSYFLPRLPGKAGTYFALTGARATLADGVVLGIVDAYVPSPRLPALLARLVAGESVDAAIAAEKADTPDSPLASKKHFIDGCFDQPSLDAILEAIDEAGYGGSEFALSTYDTIRAKSPTSLAIALRQMQIGADLDIDESMRMEYRIVSRVARGHDFYEGVRATLIDKDNKPAWQPAEIEALKSADIDAYFAPLDEDELAFTAPAGA